MEVVKIKQSGSMGIVKALEQGFKIRFILKGELIHIDYYNKTNGLAGGKSVKPTIVDNKLMEFGEMIEWSKLQSGYSYWIMKNPTSNISALLLAKLNDSVMSKEVIALSIIKGYERKYIQ